MPMRRATGAVLADLDGDGDLDLVVNTIGSGTRVLVNDGKGRFVPGAVLNPGRCGDIACRCGHRRGWCAGSVRLQLQDADLA